MFFYLFLPCSYQKNNKYTNLFIETFDNSNCLYTNLNK